MSHFLPSPHLAVGRCPRCSFTEGAGADAPTLAFPHKRGADPSQDSAVPLDDFGMALELRGTRTTVVNGEAVASQCDPVQPVCATVAVLGVGWHHAPVQGTREGFRQQYLCRRT